MIEKLFNFVGLIIQTLSSHIKVIFYDFDPVKDTSQNEYGQLMIKPAHESHLYRNRINLNHVFPALLTIYITLDTAYIFYENDFTYETKGMPLLFSHKIFPKLLWMEGDIIHLVALYVAVGVEWFQ